MSVKLEKVDTRELEVGMYVSQLDRPWIETPFPLQGFHIRSQDEVEKLRVFCKHVFIDLKLGIGPVAVKHEPVSRKPKPTIQTSVRGNIGKFKPVRYAQPVSLTKEISQAATHHRDLTRAMVHLQGQLREGKKLNPLLARKASSVVVQSVIRNPDAMVWLARLKDKDSYSYNHGARCSILAAVFGRHLGLPMELLEDLTTGAMLMDVGNVRVPKALLVKAEANMTVAEQAELKRHVQHGVDILESSGGQNDQGPLYL